MSRIIFDDFRPFCKFLENVDFDLLLCVVCALNGPKKHTINHDLLRILASSRIGAYTIEIGVKLCYFYVPDQF